MNVPRSITHNAQRLETTQKKKRKEKKQLKCSSTDEWLTKMWNIQTVDY